MLFSLIFFSNYIKYILLYLTEYFFLSFSFIIEFNSTNLFYKKKFRNKKNNILNLFIEVI
jgi:hypothetical protein